MLQRMALRNWGARLALFAVCLQFLLSFGHIHAAEIFGPLGHAVVPSHGTTVVGTPSHSSPNPAGAADVAEDACSICASLALLATGALPDPVRLPPPSLSVAIAAPQAAELAPRAVPFRLFQTRAPPAV
jgi:Protein of unknown function (DUF2946)